MADIYNIITNQSVDKHDGQGSNVEYTTFYTDKAVWDDNSINATWSTKGCYCGAKPDNGSLMGSGSFTNFTGWNQDMTQSDLRDFTTSPAYHTATQNLRFMIEYGASSRFINRRTFKWTNIRDSEKTAIERAYKKEGETGYRTDLSGTITYYSPYTLDNASVSVNGTANTPLNIAPLNEMKINNLIWLPKFLIREVEYYNYEGSPVNGYRNMTQTTGTWYTWSQIKNEDNTSEGSDYDENLFDVGYKEITATHEDGVRFKYVAGVALTPYYGACSNTYNPGTDSYISGVNPEDGYTYSSRTVYCSMTSNENYYPRVGTYTTNRPLLIVCTEVYDSTTGGVVYQMPTGILFGNAANPTGITDDFEIQGIRGFTNVINKFYNGNVRSSTDFWNNNNDKYNNLFKRTEDPLLTTPDFYTAGCIAEIDGSYISIIVNDNDYPTGVFYYLQNNGPTSFSFNKTSGNSVKSINPHICPYFSIKELWATIASLGCYVADSVSCATDAPLGRYAGNNNHLYLGEMTSDGITTGRMIQGRDIINQPQSNIDDIIQNTPYTPVDPKPGGGTDPSNPPTPSGKGEGKITGDTTTGHKTRQFGSGPISYYGLKETEVRELTGLLWSQAKDFYDAVQIAGRYNTSIFDYITSFKYYPSSLASMGFTVGSTSAIKIGTGAVLKGSNGNYQANKLTGFFSQFVWCSWSLSSYDFWYPNDAFLNYGPYMKISIYLPYAGTFDLDPQTIAANNPINQATVTVRVAIDLNTGTLTYYVDSDGVLILNKTVQFGIDLPLTGNDTIEQSKAILGSNYKSAQTVIGTASNLISNVAGGNLIGAVETIASAFVDANEKGIEACLANRQIPTQVNSFGGTMSNITQGQDPYLTFYRQKIANPSNYGHAVGYLTESTQKISTLTGFTVCRNPDVSGINATQDEKNEIQSILTSGFYA